MKHFKPVKQHDRTDCAVACIAAIARYYGLSLPLANIRQACGASIEGTTIKGIMDACQAINMEARPLKSAGKDLEAISPSQLPAILHVATAEGDPHFIVLISCDAKGALVMDPAEGRNLHISKEELCRRWSGYLVEVTPGSGFRPGNETISTRERLSKLLSLFGGEIAASIVFSLLYILAGISFSLFLQYFIDKIIPSGDAGRIAAPALAMTLLSFLAFLIGKIRINTLLTAATGIDQNIIGSFILHLFRLPVAFFSQRGAGEINSRIGDAYTIRRFVTEGISSVIISLFTLLTSFVLMFTFQWRLALLTALFVPVYTLIYYLATRAGNRYNREIIAGSTLFEKRCVESIAAVRSIKYAGVEREASRNIGAQYTALCDKIYKGGSVAGGYGVLAETVSKLLTVVLLSAGSLIILKGDLSVGTLVGFYSITTFFSAPLGQLVGVSSLVTQTRISSRRLFEVMDLEEERPDGSDPAPVKGDLVFDSVTFCYPGSMNLLEDFQATIPAGKITVVKGRSGCGKSSLAALAMRLYSPSKGTITLGGIDISLFDLAKWRRKVTIVPQDVRLFDDSILFNITGQRKDYDLERVAHLMVDLGLENIARDLPRGIMTLVGESGCRLSGGQKQRIAIAAALYRQPDILILDEATNSLDAASQQKMLEVIKRENTTRSLTVIMITHKADEIPIADKLIEM